MKRKVAYVILFAVLISFAIREAGVIYGKRFNRPLLPEWLSFLEDVDRAILFFSDRGGPVYSTINYLAMLGAIFGIGLLRALKKKTGKGLSPLGPNAPQVGVVLEGENPFYVAVPEWGAKDKPVDIYRLLSEQKSKGHGVAGSPEKKKAFEPTSPPAPHDNHVAPTGKRRRTIVFELAVILFVCAVFGAVVLSLNSGSAPVQNGDVYHPMSPLGVIL